MMRTVKLVLALLMVMAIGLPSFATTYFDEDMEAYEPSSLSGDVTTHNGGTFTVTTADGGAVSIVDSGDTTHGQVLDIDDSKTSRVWVKMALSEPRNEALLFQYDIAELDGWEHTCIYIYGDGWDVSDRAVYTRWQDSGNPHKLRNIAATSETLMEYTWTSTPRWFHVEMTVPEYDETDPASSYHMYVVDMTDGTVMVDGDYSLSTLQTEYSHLMWYQCTTDYGHFYLDNVKITSPRVAAPVMSPAGGEFMGSQDVTISCDDATAVIRYTVDGSEPTSSSPVYSGVITLDADTVINAKAFPAAGSTYLESVLVSEAYDYTTGYYFNEDMEAYSVGELYGYVDTHHGGTFWVYDNPADAGTVEIVELGGEQGKVLKITDDNPSVTRIQMAMDSAKTRSLMLQYDIADISGAGYGHCENHIANSNGGDAEDRAAYWRWTARGNPHKLNNMAATATRILEYTWSESEVKWLHVEVTVPEAGIGATDYHVYVVDKASGEVLADGDYPLLNQTSDYTMFQWYQCKEDYGIFYLDNVKISWPRIEAPVISPSGGYLATAQSVTITHSDLSAVIRYTVDGSEPTETSPVYDGPIEVSTDTTIKAVAWLPNELESVVVTESYAFSVSLNDPETIASCTGITVDADLSDWSDATWVALDQAYDVDPLSFDVVSASYAAKWDASGQKVYVAVKVLDTDHVFSADYGTCSGRDAVELYLHNFGQGDVNYHVNQDVAQQYAVGIALGTTDQVWASLADTKTLPVDLGFEAAGQIVTVGTDDWIYYEVAMTPFDYYGGISGEPTEASTLAADDYIGLDVCVVAYSSSDGYTGMLSENLMRSKYCDWTQFGVHQLVSGTLLPGDANGDGSVDVGDLGILAANYGTTTGATWATGDFNGDEAVDVGDLGILAANYGTNSSSADFDADYAKVFGQAVSEDESEENTTLCGAIGLPLIAGLALMGLLLVKLEE